MPPTHSNASTWKKTAKNLEIERGSSDRTWYCGGSVIRPAVELCKILAECDLALDALWYAGSMGKSSTWGYEAMARVVNGPSLHWSLVITSC